MIPRYSRPEMAALWSDDAKFKLWLEVETVALEGMAELGIVPKEAAVALREKGAFDVQRILEIEKEVKHDVIAFLTSVGEHVGEQSRYVHFGMTSSDLIDTAFALQLRQATDIILSGTDALLEEMKSLAIKHKKTMCIGRSHGIHAEPMTFGLKVANWYAEISRQRKRIAAARVDISMGAISGPVGTYSQLPPDVEAYVCKKLGLSQAPISTQVISRDVHCALFLSFAQLAASLERVAVEIRHLQRTEVREAEEFFSKGQKGSSAMPHKRNPILSENVSGIARLIRSLAETSFENVPLWHERDISHSAVERVIAPDITILLDFILHRTKSIVSGLVVYPKRMQENLDMTRGLIYSATLLVALANTGMSREAAYTLVQSHALKTWEDLENDPQTKDFESRVRDDAEITKRLSPAELDKVFSFERHTKYVDTIFNRVFN